MSPHDATNEYTFTIAKNVLQIFTHQIDAENNESGRPIKDKNNKSLMKLCFSHEDCCANKWLEIRLGDAATRDQLSVLSCFSLSF